MSKIGFSAFSVSEVPRLSDAMVSAAVLPVIANWPASSRMTMEPPLTPLWVIELALPEAAAMADMPTDVPLLLVGRLVPGTFSDPPAAWPLEFVPTSPLLLSAPPLPPQL
ncbi:hypothetical protein D9M68_716690 [compost metagenome]